MGNSNQCNFSDMNSCSPCLSPQMTVLEIVSQYRATVGVFKSWDGRAGVCICCQALFDTVEQIAKRFNLDQEVLMAELNAAANPVLPMQSPQTGVTK